MEGLLDSYTVGESVGEAKNGSFQPDLGVDDEVVVKTRRKYAKLDESKFLEFEGIPKLRKHIVPRLRLKGKGHERRDLTKLLGTYQLWAHNLFPKANFDDFIYLAKRAGSTRSMRAYRRQWIEEDKNGIAYENSPSSFDSETNASNELDHSTSLVSEEQTVANDKNQDLAPNDLNNGGNELFFGDYSDDGIHDDGIPDDEEMLQLESQVNRQDQDQPQSQNKSHSGKVLDSEKRPQLTEDFNEFNESDSSKEPGVSKETLDAVELAAMEAAMELGF